MEKYLIVGLGNPGDDYSGTRHNTGFMILDAFAKASNIIFEDKRYGFIGETSLKGRRIILLKPTTFMNLSGNAVRYWLDKEHIDQSHLLVIVDDLALPLGMLRLKATRLRVGIGNDFARGRQIDWVLGKYDEEDMKKLQPCIETACEIIRSFVLAGINMTMNQFNGHPQKTSSNLSKEGENVLKDSQ